MSPAAEKRCKHGRAARRKLRRERLVHNAALIASAQEAAEEEAAFSTSYRLRSQTGTSARCSSLDGEALPSSMASKKRQRYEGVPQPTEEQVVAFAPHGGAIGCFDDRLPANHCGGDLYITSLVLADLCGNARSMPPERACPITCPCPVCGPTYIERCETCGGGICAQCGRAMIHPMPCRACTCPIGPGPPAPAPP